jgi:nicotinate-nucleotide adenylyltransferase
MRFAILGGSFDPVHNGHLRLAEAVRDRFGYDAVILVPANRSPQKSVRPVAGPQERLAMVRLAVQGHSALEISDVELRRGGTSYTVDTVEQLAEELSPEARPGLVIGADLAEGFSKWRRSSDLLALAQLIVVDRPGFNGALEWPHATIRGFTMTESSSEIRQRIADGEPWESMVPSPVVRFIVEHSLYTDHEGHSAVVQERPNA